MFQAIIQMGESKEVAAGEPARFWTGNLRSGTFVIGFSNRTKF
jgi:hypothetical protein